LAGLKAAIVGQVETELVPIKAQASLLISNVDSDGMNPEMGLLSIQANRGHLFPRSGERVSHRLIIVLPSSPTPFEAALLLTAATPDPQSGLAYP
jgi:hypothetical protein